ncbi:Diphthamide biosynthesis protein 1 [Pyrenophora tritici-repentis]|nr:Diphthamide biosynthesis protein 1 [Pyrenophora tritici-repentis]
MEDDRAATNLGPEAAFDMAEEAELLPKQPKKRFVGRKMAAKASGQQADANASIEDSSAIQGVRRSCI